MEWFAKALFWACEMIEAAVVVASINAISDLQFKQKVWKIGHQRVSVSDISGVFIHWLYRTCGGVAKAFVRKTSSWLYCTWHLHIAGRCALSLNFDTRKKHDAACLENGPLHTTSVNLEALDIWCSRIYAHQQMVQNTFHETCGCSCQQELITNKQKLKERQVLMTPKNKCSDAFGEWRGW